MWNNVSACNAECLHIFSHCICHCLPGYILVDGKCIKSKIAFFFYNALFCAIGICIIV